MNNKSFSSSDCQKTKKVKYILIVILGMLLFGGLAVPTNLINASSRNRAREARVKADVAQLRTIAEIIYEEKGNYLNVNCNYGEIKTICEDIANQVGARPTIRQSADKWCAYTKLIQPPRAYFCVDSGGRAQETYLNPGEPTHCTETTFLCPTETGTISSSAYELSPDVIFYSLLTKVLFFGGIFLSLILSVVIHYLKRKKEKAVKIEDNNVPISENLKLSKAFYIWLILLIVSIILYSYNFLIRYFLGNNLFLFLFLPLLVGIIATIGFCYQTIKLIKKSNKIVYQKLCWEGFFSMITIAVTWLIFFTSQIWIFSITDVTTDTAFLFLRLLSGLAIGFSISTLFHKGKINKIIGVITLFLMLYFSHATGLWIFFLA